MDAVVITASKKDQNMRVEYAVHSYSFISSIGSSKVDMSMLQLKKPIDLNCLDSEFQVQGLQLLEVEAVLAFW
jgi:hypothetical protein